MSKCSAKECSSLATKLIRVDAHLREGDAPIVLLLGLEVCDRCAEEITVEIISDDMWNILDTWAIQKRKGLIDRDLVRVVPVPIGSDEARMLLSRNRLNG